MGELDPIRTPSSRRYVGALIIGVAIVLGCFVGASWWVGGPYWKLAATIAVSGTLGACVAGLWLRRRKRR